LHEIKKVNHPRWWGCTNLPIYVAWKWTSNATPPRRNTMRFVDAIYPKIRAKVFIWRSVDKRVMECHENTLEGGTIVENNKITNKGFQ
jgi:hypothetical protein